MSRWRFFTDEESAGVKDDVMFKLDRARELFDAPIVMTCGYRSPEDNAKIGGVPDSEHIYGLAADVKAPADPAMREKLVWALCVAGFKRLESAPKHFHVGVTNDGSKPSPCFWQGTDH